MRYARWERKILPFEQQCTWMPRINLALPKVLMPYLRLNAVLDLLDIGKVVQYKEEVVDVEGNVVRVPPSLRT